MEAKPTRGRKPRDIRDSIIASVSPGVVLAQVVAMSDVDAIRTLLRASFDGVGDVKRWGAKIAEDDEFHRTPMGGPKSHGH